MEFAKPKMITKLRKKDVPAAPQQAGMPEYEDTTSYEEFQAPEENSTDEIDQGSMLPKKNIPGVEEAVGPDDLLIGSGAGKAGVSVLKKLVSREAPAAVSAARPLFNRATSQLGRNVAAEVEQEAAANPSIYKQALNEMDRQAAAPQAQKPFSHFKQMWEKELGRKLDPSEIEEAQKQWATSMKRSQLPGE